MSQVVGSTFRSRIPTFNDDASIEEALRVYHYGVDNYTSQPIPDDSIEGNFRTLTTNLNTADANAIQRLSKTAAPNIITAQAVNVIPLTVKAIASQTSSLQIWQNSSSTSLAEITTTGNMFLTGTLALGSSAVSSSYLLVNQASPSIKGIIIRAANSSTSNLQEWQNNSSTVLASVDQLGNFVTSSYLTVGAPSISSTTSISSTILNASHKGIIVRGASAQTANLQEWQNSAGTVLSRVDNNGNLYINEIDVLSGSLINSLMLMGG